MKDTLITLVAIFVSQSALADDAAIKSICTYHAAIVTDTTSQMLKGVEYEAAATYALDRFRDTSEAKDLEDLETALSIMTVDEAGRLGEITGKVSVFWYITIREKLITATYESLYGQSYDRCVEGANEHGVVEHFNRYEEAIYRIRERINPPT